MVSTHIKYRRDIDGLRALAVLSVILFHINAKWMPGGFLGVDIFFVISGYLITLILAKEVTETNRINIVNFYKRRIKRIIPALLFVLIPVFIVGFFLFAPENLLSLSKSMIWSFFSAANIYFFASIDTGYFATGSNELPLLHLWSLGVEEQFYILWPFIVLVLLKYVRSLRNRILITSILFIASIVLAQFVIVTHHSFAYYMLPTRAWELLAGAFVALLIHSGFRTKNFISEILASIGLIMIILSLIFVSESDPVPGIAALPVIIGATLLILSGSTYHTFIGRILSFKLFVAIGLVSYSAYLWHWPILALLRYALIEIDISVAFIVLMITFFMATISYFGVENPLRKKKVSSKNVFLLYFILPAIIIVTMSVLTIQAIKNKNPLIFPWEQLSNLKEKTKSPHAYSYNCQYSRFYINAYDQDRCVYPMNIVKANVLLIGDSNAAHYLGMLRVFSEYFGFSIRNATQSSCPMVFDSEFDWVNPKYKKGCSTYTHSVAEQTKKYDTVIVGGVWSSYYDKEGFQESFKNTIGQLSKNTNHVILLAKVPKFPEFNNDCEVKSIRLNSLECQTHFNNILTDDISNEFLRRLAKQYSNVEYFDIRKQVCKNGVCSPYIDGIPVYYDYGHLSMMGSTHIGKKMIDTNDTMLHVFDHLHNIKQIYKIKTNIEVKENDTFFEFTLKPEPQKKKAAFFLYKNGEHIHTQWFRKNFSYKMNKKKYGNGKYRVRFFLVDDDIKNPGKNGKKESGYSEFFELK